MSKKNDVLTKMLDSGILMVLIILIIFFFLLHPAIFSALILV